MVSIVTKKIKGKEYNYLVASIRKGGRVIQKTIKYIGKKRPIAEEEFECMVMSYRNEDWVLAGFNDFLSYQDHAQLKNASDSCKTYLKRLDRVSKEKEKEKFLSVFISNSNAIEGSTLTVKETFNYLFKDTVPKNHTKKELYMASNMFDAWNYIEKNYKRFLKPEDLFALHKLVNKGIESEATLGKYKKVQNYIGDVHTTSYLYVEERINLLFKWIKQAFRRINNFEVSFQSHAQFEIIHPFVDGNGRVGRLLLSWLLMYKGFMPLAMRMNQREGYISALDNARKGKIEAICAFCFSEYVEQYRFL